MLLLGRRPGERVRILTPQGEEIWVTMHDYYLSVNNQYKADLNNPKLFIEHDKVVIVVLYISPIRLGIDAPKNYQILREELITRNRKRDLI